MLPFCYPRHAIKTLKHLPQTDYTHTIIFCIGK
nr:MAG TPA: hypothetical protein [Caudoviricetes sp.]